MATTASGAANVDVQIVDFSVLLNTAVKGKTGYLGVTQRGVPSQIYDIGSWDEYQIKLGGLVDGNPFPLYCKRALEAGGRLKVVPAGKYTNPTDKTTLSGVKAALTVAQTTAAAVGSTATIEAAANATAAGTVTVIAKIPGASDVVLADSVAVTSGDTPTVIAAALETAIDAGTGTHGFSSDDASPPELVITAPTSYGAWGRNIQIQVVVTGGVTFNNYLVQMSGGADALSNADAVFTAKAKGTAYNNVTVAATFAASGSQSHYDLTVSISDNTAPTETYRDIPRDGDNAGMAAKLAQIVAASELLSAITIDADFTFQPFSTALSGGTNGDALTATDYAGNSTQKTNLYAFDDDMEITKIAIPDVTDGTLAKTLADYCDARKDIIGLHRTPISVSPDVVLEYRKGSGAYDHVPINSWRNLMFAGGLRVTNPLDNLPIDISEIGDVTGIIARKDNTVGEWFAFAGDKRGVVRNALGVLTNVGTGAYRAKADDYDRNGIIPVIQDANKNIKVWGNATLYQESSLLQKAEVAELIVFLYRSLNQLIPRELWEPNDPQTWKAIYRRVAPFIIFLANNRALWNKPEDVDLWYQGDQNAQTINDIVVNTPEGIDAGQYKFRLFLQPKVALKYVIVPVIITNSGVDFGELTETTTI